MNSYPDPIGTVNAYFDAIDARLQRTRDLLDKCAADRVSAARQSAHEAQRQQERLAAMRAYVPTDTRGDGRGITPLWEYLVLGDPPEPAGKTPGKRKPTAPAEREAIAETASSAAPMWITPKPFKPRAPKPSLLDGLATLAGNSKNGGGRSLRNPPAIPALVA